jgi:hypothetical protein
MIIRSTIEGEGAVIANLGAVHKEKYRFSRRTLWNRGTPAGSNLLGLKSERRLSVTENECLEKVGTPTMMACPVCTNVLYEVVTGDESRFCCSEGHDFSVDEICPGIEQSLSGLFTSAIEAVLKADK